MSKVHNGFLGKSAEYQVVVELLKRGYNVFFPAAEFSGIDLIATKGTKRPIRLQIKSTVSKEKKKRSYRLQINSWRRHVEKKQADVFICVTPDGFYLFDANEIEHLRFKTVTPKLVSFENWSLLDKLKL